MQTAKILIKKIKTFPPQRVAEVIDFVDFLTQKEERKLVQSASRLSKDAFAKIWDNDEDAVYNEKIS